ncbi:hypothetical protein RSOLAG22IIIB_01298 [Rhizoctonia solani]|uniref:BTB domain-containing protein n=1 Tax=Rhizoctonia solani TaxID=456999 RepID=A0A0K6G5L1_9AGAM|nr:hypothetical protein RSOLAG22IIIB_01298 [Rhizoctonia solani]
MSDTEHANEAEEVRHGEQVPPINGDAHHEKEKQDSGDPQIIADNPNVVDMGQSDIELRVNNTIFKTHKYFLSKFTRLEDMIRNSGCHDSAPCITLYRDEGGVNDINNTFKILYASTVEGPFSFDTPVLISALRIATAYGFEAMRTFAIQHLEKMSLGAIQRIQLAREFGLSSWEDPAFKELSERENAITEDEAQVLGFTTFARLAQAREDVVLKRGKLLGEQEHKDKLKKEQEEKAKKEAEAKAKKEAEEKAKKEAEAKAKKEAEEKAKKEAEAKAKKEAEEKAKKEAEAKAKKEADEKAKKEAAEKAKKEADAKAKKEADEKAKKEGKK